MTLIRAMDMSPLRTEALRVSVSFIYQQDCSACVDFSRIVPCPLCQVIGHGPCLNV